jgi:hypothetical protein
MEYAEDKRVSAAFLQATFKKNERVFMDPPPEFGEDPEWVWELLKSCYGLKVAGLAWNLEVDNFMKTLNINGTTFKPTVSDPCVYTHRDKRGKLDMVVDVHVDDFMYGGKPAVQQKFQKALGAKWKITSTGQVRRHLGVNYTWSKDGKSVDMDQHDTIDDLLIHFNMTECRAVKVPCEKRLSKPKNPITPEEEEFMRDKRYNKGVGSLLWIARQTRPDLEWVTNHLSQFLSDPRPEHWALFIHVLRYLSGTRYFVFRYFRSPRKILMRTDSDWAPKEEEKRRSTSAYVSLWGNCALSWKSKKQDSTAESSAEAELIALALGAKEAIWMRRFLGELDIDGQEESMEIQNKEDCLEIQVDNNACNQIANNRMQSERTKHLDVKYFAVRGHIDDGRLSVTRVDTADNTSDIFTKPLLQEKFRRFRAELGVVPN